jgi:tetratricopeptide (TPR) repeat protein
MHRPKVKLSESDLDKMLGKASWLLSHAEALACYGRDEEAAAELARAASCEEEVAFWLDAAGRQQEAVIHRVSAASCYEQLGQYARAVTLLQAALSADLVDQYRRRVEQLLARCLAQAKKKVRGASPHAPRGPRIILRDPIFSEAPLDAFNQGVTLAEVR